MTKTNRKMDAALGNVQLNGQPMSKLTLLLALALLFVLTLSISLNEVESAAAEFAPVESSGNYNDIDSLISDLVDERLKKSKLGGRQVKQTLRFGRRSDPMWAPTNVGQISLEELLNNPHYLD